VKITTRIAGIKITRKLILRGTLAVTSMSLRDDVASPGRSPGLERERLLMVLVGALSLASFAAVSLPEISRGVRIGALVVMAFVFLAMHGTIYEIDHKFDGVIQVEPVEMILRSSAIADQFTERRPHVALPCNERGLPLRRPA
jgi:hypothetical protein